MPDFLFELFSEEIPARMQKQAMLEATKIWGDLLKEANVTAATLSSFMTPRRLTVHIQGLPEALPALTEDVKGPRVSAPPQALDGFMKSQGITKDHLIEQDDPKGAYYIYKKDRPAVEVSELLPQLIPSFMNTFPWPKSMRWSANSFRWVRPLHNILAVFNSKTLEGQFSLGDDTLAFTNTTYGHRFLKPEAITVKTFEDYKKSLNDAYVMLDTENRKADILRQLTALAEKNHITLSQDPALLQEMAGAAEWPQVFMGRIPEAYVILPEEVLTTAMRVHQKYFAFTKKEGGLAPYFATVANNIPRDQGAMIIEGNEQILNSRLFDAHFFWEQDLKANFGHWQDKLKAITFHTKLGTVHERVERLKLSAAQIAERIGADREKATHAASLCKIDLVSEMVYEFPELQGIMGGHYALAKSEPPEVAAAIREHYAPQGPEDICPTAPVSVALALAEKLDTLVGFFSIDEKPTGSKDPYALRRAALGVIRLVLENKISLSLSELISISAESYQACVEHMEDLITFFKDRLKVILRDQGYPHDYVMAVLATGDNLLLITERAKALQDFLKTEDGQALLVLYRRAASIVKKEKTAEFTLDQELLAEEAEKTLFDRLSTTTPDCRKALETQDYVRAMKTLSPLKESIDSFFDHVTVNDPNETLRQNRYALLETLLSLIHMVADLSQIEG